MGTHPTLNPQPAERRGLCWPTPGFFLVCVLPYGGGWVFQKIRVGGCSTPPPPSPRPPVGQDILGVGVGVQGAGRKNWPFSAFA